MNLPENAVAAYQVLAEQLSKPESSDFFLANPYLTDLLPAAQAVIGFAVARPALLVNNASDKKLLLGYLDNEWVEASQERGGDPQELFKELGDVGFFALLTGLLYWSELDADEKQEVVGGLMEANVEAMTNGMKLGEAVVYVASVKDPINYPEEFLDVFDDEVTSEIPLKVTELTGHLRTIRHALNGKWKDSADLSKTVAEYFHAAQEGDPLIESIQGLFVLSRMKFS
jgi:hypothetical protein